MFKSMKIGTKLISAFILVAIIGAMIGGVGWYGADILIEEFGQIQHHDLAGAATYHCLVTANGDVVDDHRGEIHLDQHRRLAGVE